MEPSEDRRRPMKNVLLFGATGHLGRAIAVELKSRGYQLDLAVRNPARAESLKIPRDRTLKWDPVSAESLPAIFGEPEVVISSLGKSVSPNARDKQSFNEVDFQLNLEILNHAIARNVRKFVYISAFHSERYQHLEYFRVHEAFSNELKQSGIDYAIVKPTSLFSAYLDMIPMAKKGALFTIGKGACKTNPIAEKDVAKLAVDAIGQPNVVIDAGGPGIYTRRELAEILQQAIAPDRKVKRMPVSLLRFFLPLIRVADRNLFDKMDFFVEVMEADTVAPVRGMTRFEDFVLSVAEQSV